MITLVGIDAGIRALDQYQSDVKAAIGHIAFHEKGCEMETPLHIIVWFHEVTLEENVYKRTLLEPISREYQSATHYALS